MNGTAEAILDELLKNSKAQTEILKKLAGAFKPTTGGGGAGGPGGGLGGLASAATDVVKNFNPMIKAISMVANLLGSFSAGIGAIIGGFADLGGHLFDLAKKASEGKARLHDLFDAFADLPLGIGKVASLFSSMVKVSENLLDTYRPLTESGASFGGKLIEVSNIATRAGLTIGEFQKIVKENSQTFASLGGSVADGITKFADANSDLVGPNSKFKEAIFGMGYTADQASQMLATMTKGQGAMGRAGSATAEQLAKYTAEYMTQLDELTKITGQKALATISKKDVASFKLRKGMPIGAKVTLRGEKMYEFLDRLITSALPRVRDFSGIKATGFDGRGNYNLGVLEQIIFPEIDIDKVNKISGMDITFVTSAQTDKEAKSLLAELGLPFKKN